MRNEKDVEAYLLRLNRRFSAVEDKPGTFLIDTQRNMPPVALRVEAPLVVLRVHVGDASQGDQLPMFRKLLELNASSLVHASYGLDGNQIVLSGALQLENLDFNELEAALDEIDMALVQQVPMLVGLSPQSQKGQK
jgi:hypothetical protein